MITKIKSSPLSPKRGYFYPEYESEGKISNRTRQKLIEYIYGLNNLDEDEKEARVSELDSLSENEACEMLYQTWRLG